MNYRMVHDGTKVLLLTPATGVTQTRHTMFVGTAAACAAEAKRLNLTSQEVAALTRQRDELNTRIGLARAGAGA